MLKIRFFKNVDTFEIIKLISNVVKEFLEYNDNDLKDLIKNLSDINNNYFNKWGTFIVCEDDDKIIGTIAIICEKDNIAKLKRMYLYKEYRRKGYGSKLFDFAENWCKNNNFNKIILSTYFPFIGAKFYERKGFEKNRIIWKKVFYEKKLK